MQNRSNIERRTIVIVEDSTDDQIFLLTSLKEVGVKNPFLFLNTGGEALQYFFPVNEEARTPCIIILDLVLPDMNGLDLLRKLRANPETRTIPVLILTQSTEEKDVLEGYRAGANSYIIKASTYAEFQDKIQCVARYWLEVAQLPPVLSA
jgi:two-component system response regulator